MTLYEMDIPERVQRDRNAAEMLRFWAIDEAPCVSVRFGPREDPAIWGLMFHDAVQLAAMMRRDIHGENAQDAKDEIVAALLAHLDVEPSERNASTPIRLGPWDGPSPRASYGHRATGHLDPPEGAALADIAVEILRIWTTQDHGWVFSLGGWLFAEVAKWGIAISDATRLVADAWADGDEQNGQHVHQRMIQGLLAELRRPTASPRRIED